MYGPCRTNVESVDLSMYPVIVARQRSVITLPRQRRNGGVVLYAARVVSKESDD
jgi:hypothetical protein